MAVRKLKDSARCAESLHALSDLRVSGFLLAAAYSSHKRADATQLFGYGRAQLLDYPALDRVGRGEGPEMA